MNVNKILGAAIAFFISSTLALGESHIYVAESASGNGSGSACAAAKPVGALSPSDWTAGSTIHLCGDISRPIAARGSGTRSNPITVLFEPGAKISMPACPNSGCLQLGDWNHIVVDGGKPCGFVHRHEVLCNGTIESTLNGTPGGRCSAGTCSRQVGSNGVSFGGSGIEVRNLNIWNMYVHTNASDDAKPCNPGCQAVIGGIGRVHHIVGHDNAWGITLAVGANVYNTSQHNTDHCTALIGPGTGGSWHDNQCWNPAPAWNTTSNAWHHDGLHMFNSPATGSSSGTQIYNNYIWGNWGGGNSTSHYYIEGNFDRILFFNNVSIRCIPADAGVCSDWAGGEGELAFYEYSGGTATANGAYNNTFIGAFTYNQGQHYFTFLNNIASNNAMGFAPDAPPPAGAGPFTFAPGGLDYNVYDGIFSVGLNGTTYTSLAGWRAATGQDAHAVAGKAKISQDGTLQPGSLAIDAGANLTYLCSTARALCSDANGMPRPITGPWDAGAYQHSANESSAWGGSRP